MGSSIAIFANSAIEKVAWAATADVDPIILRQAEIKDFGAAVIEWNSLAPSDLGQLLHTEGLGHRYIFMDGHKRVSEKSQS